ncbi:unnamed protein product [Thelazia callipaeda]|uniref:Ubiquitin-like-conjugating enzyme ATG10 n=1 Tax=Thelazia callipaeda TaxID=103827 RepID=A0A0N5D8Q3_THECL|nr:unnamed protein product [Thelazia callipaeda]
MGTISKAKFDQDIEELVRKTADFDISYQWHIKEHRNGQFCANNSVVERNGETIMRTFHITYSEIYNVPILWFIFSRQTGALLDIDEILEMIPVDTRKRLMADSLTSISQREHPFFNLFFYHIHPCKTAAVMKNVIYDNYIISWLSIFASLLHLLPLPNELFTKNDSSLIRVQNSE